MRLAILAYIVLWAGVSIAAARDALAWERSWSSLKETKELKVGQIVPGGPGVPPEQLKIDNPTDEPKTVTLLDLQHPGVTKFHYALEGSVRYEDVKGPSYLEMWSWFSNGDMCFSRTLGDSGPMQLLQGSSDWRPFSLPFFSDAKYGPPTRVVVNVVFVGRGTVYLTPVKLLQYENSEGLLRGGVGWWSDRDAGILGAMGGVFLGLLLTLIGILAGFGKARRFVMPLTVLLAAAGVLNLLIGLLALAFGQPYAVYYPLLLFGALPAGLCGGLFPVLRHRYEQVELRKMAAMDVR